MEFRAIRSYSRIFPRHVPFALSQHARHGQIDSLEASRSWGFASPNGLKESVVSMFRYAEFRKYTIGPFLPLRLHATTSNFISFIAARKSFCRSDGIFPYHIFSLGSQRRCHSVRRRSLWGFVSPRMRTEMGTVFAAVGPEFTGASAAFVSPLSRPPPS